MTARWACPVCLAPIVTGGSAPACVGCGETHRRTADGRPDFRPQTITTIGLEYRYDPAWGRLPWEIVRLDWPGQPPSFEAPAEWQPTERSLLRAIPSAPAGARSLDLGCGLDRQRFAEPLRRLGYDHVGIDIDGTAPDALADMHVLPFETATFDLLVTSAVLEHVKHPHVAVAEAARVARPGALFVGTVAFSEPYHISYFHHSPLAVYELLESSGFSVQHLILSNEWNAFQAHLEMGFAGARYPQWLRTTLSRSIFRVALLHAWVKRLIGRGTGPLQQDTLTFARSHSALVGFVAVRTPREAESRVVRRSNNVRDRTPSVAGPTR